MHPRRPLGDRSPTPRLRLPFQSSFPGPGEISTRPHSWAHQREAPPILTWSCLPPSHRLPSSNIVTRTKLARARAREDCLIAGLVCLLLWTKMRRRNTPPDTVDEYLRHQVVSTLVIESEIVKAFPDPSLVNRLCTFRFSSSTLRCPTSIPAEFVLSLLSQIRV